MHPPAIHAVDVIISASRSTSGPEQGVFGIPVVDVGATNLAGLGVQNSGANVTSDPGPPIWPLGWLSDGPAVAHPHTAGTVPALFAPAAPLFCHPGEPDALVRHTATHLGSSMADVDLLSIDP